jgi:hypothetical protein
VKLWIYWRCLPFNSYICLVFLPLNRRPSWSWSYGSLIYNYLCNQCLSPLTLWFRIPLRRGLLDITYCDKVCQWLAAGRWFSPFSGYSVSSINKTDHHDITEILLKVTLNTLTTRSPLLMNRKPTMMANNCNNINKNERSLLTSSSWT